MLRWYVVYAQAQAEQCAHARLTAQGYHCFLPLLRKVRRHARRQETVLRPMFPRYLFVLFDVAKTQWRAINGTRGVIKILTQSVEPLPVPVGVVESLMQQASGDVVPVTAFARLWKGRKVRIDAGPFLNQMGEIDEVLDDRARVSLLMSILGKSVTLEVPAYALEPV